MRLRFQKAEALRARGQTGQSITGHVKAEADFHALVSGLVWNQR